jgi:hypothetical protein
MPSTDSAQISSWVQGLSNSDPYRREESGLRIYLAGVNLFMPLLTRWIDDLSFREMTLPFSRIAEEQAKNGPSTIIIGIAVNPETFERIRIANNAPHMAEVPADQDAKEFELEMDAGAVKIDVLTTLNPSGSGAIARYLEKFGTGIQQVELYVRDVDRATEILKSNFGLQPVYPATRAGADRTRVNFFLATTPDAKKLLVELVEAKC